MAPLETAVRELRLILSEDPAAPEWRWTVRRRLSEVLDALEHPQAREAEAWLAARAQRSNRVRHRLRARVGAVASGVLERWETEAVLREVGRLLGDLEHLVQRQHDLAYDAVALELGGSD